MSCKVDLHIAPELSIAADGADIVSLERGCADAGVRWTVGGDWLAQELHGLRLVDRAAYAE